MPEEHRAISTEILGPSLVERDAAKRWAISRQGTHAFAALADLYWRLASIHSAAVRPEIAYCQAAKESAFGRYGGLIDAGFMNPSCIKTREGGPDEDPSAHQRFASWEEGILAHLDHLALYAGAEGYPRAGSPDPRHFPELFGQAKRLEELSGRWASDPEYGRALAESFLADLIRRFAAPPDGGR